jgi:hypothetical protein
MVSIKVYARDDGLLEPADDNGIQQVKSLNSQIPFPCEIKTSRARSIPQNSLWAAMYKRISRDIGDGGSAQDINHWRAESKLMLGAPILLRDSEEFRKGWNAVIAIHPYSWQLRMMGANALFGPDGFPVTRLFNTKQGAEYTDSILNTYVPQGVNFNDLLKGAA